MKQKKPYLRKVGTMLCAVAICVLTVGTISVYALVGGTEIDTGRETKAATDNNPNTVTDYATNFQVEGITQTSLVKNSETTKATNATTSTTATEKTTKKTAAATTKTTTATKAETTVASTVKTTAVKPKTTKAATTTSKETQKITTIANSTKSSAIKYTDEEFEMMCYVIENEAGSLSAKSKIAVSNVIINRVRSSGFGDSISGVLTAQGQFTAINNYYNKTNPPTQHTKDCVKRALNGEDYSNGALYYYAPKYCGGSTAAWFESLEFCMELEGQRFFK